MKLRQGLLVLSVLLAGAVASRADSVVSPILITIDESNPSAVTFTFTSAAPSASDTSNIFNDGIVLETFFTSTQSYVPGNTSSTTLTTSIDGTPFYDDYHTDDVTGPNYTDINLYTDFSNADQGNTENFSTSSQAFAGTATIDLSEFGLPALGATGVLAAGYSDSSVTPIGFWEVTAGPAAVPEPSQWGGLAVLGVMGFVFARRFRLIKI